MVPTPGTIFHHLTTEDDPDAEPPAVMAEAALVLCSAKPKALTGRVAYSQELLSEMSGTRLPPDACQLRGPARNAKIADQALNDRAAELAGAFSLPAGAGSDAHDAPGVGAAYLEMPDFDGPASFLAALAHARVTGEFRPHAAATHGASYSNGHSYFKISFVTARCGPPAARGGSCRHRGRARWTSPA